MVALRLFKQILILSFHSLKHSYSRTILIFPLNERRLRSALKSSKFLKQLRHISILFNLKWVQLGLVSVGYHVVHIVTWQRSGAELNCV